MSREIVGMRGRPQCGDMDGAATMKRRTGANFLATREESLSTAMRRAASKPSPIRSTFSSLKCEIDCNVEILTEKSGRIGATQRVPNDIGTASLTTPRGLPRRLERDTLYFFGLGIDAWPVSELTPEIGQRQPSR